MRTKTTLEKAVKFVNNCKFIFSFKKNIFQKNIFTILFCLITALSFAQTKNIDSYLTDLETSGQESTSTQLKHLLFDLQSAVYLSSTGDVNVYGEHPTSLFVNINSINSLGTANIAKENIEIATVKIESSSDLSRLIDLTAFSGFSKLKYIFILSEVQTSQTVIDNLIKNDNSKYILIYKISIGG